MKKNTILILIAIQVFFVECVSTQHSIKDAEVSFNEAKFDDKSQSINRINKGLVALYQFKEGKGDVVRDISGVEPILPLNITKNDEQEISWISGGGIRTNPGDYRLDKSSMKGEISSLISASKITNAIKQTGMFSVEIWANPANVEQLGPVRLVSISNGNGSRNVTIGHAGHAYDFRIRTSETNKNGLPALRTKDKFQAKAKPTHIVLTYTGDSGKVYINGELVSWSFYEGIAPGDDIFGNLKGWDSSYRLILGNETSGTRAWKGDLNLVAFYNRALSKEEIAQNLAAKY